MTDRDAYHERPILPNDEETDATSGAYYPYRTAERYL
jgi:hypothetical protein